MALIGRIRKNFWFVLLVLGLALAAFVIMDMVNAGNRGGLGPQQVVGEVAGQKIDYMDFQKVEQALYSNSQDNLAAKSSVWNYLVEKAIINDQAEKTGLTVTRDELMDLQFGADLSPVIQNTFRNPQTGQVDRQQLLNIKQAIENGEELNQKFRLSWSEQQKQIKKTAIQEKLTNMVSKAMITPSFVVETNEKNANASVSFEYVKIPFDQIADSEVSITDADINAYIDENKSLYTTEDETRTIAYVVKDVYPTSADSSKWREQVAQMASEFEKKSANQDSLYTVNNQGFFSTIYAAKDKLSETLQGNISNMSVGDVYGPYLDNGAYWAAKLTDKAVIADSVSARHILRSVTNGDVAQLAAANTYIDSLENLIKTGKSTMEELATNNSQDPGSSFKGGDLGTFAQGAMVPAFNNAVFIGSREGGLYTVETQFGVHLIQVGKKVYNDRNPKYKLAYLRVPITPSQETQDNVYDEISDLVDEARDYAALVNAVDGRNDLSLENASPVKENDYIFGTFGSDNTSRDIIKWAFESDVEVGNVSPSVYTYTDKVNYFNSKYVVAALKTITEPGLATAESVRDQLELPVTNWKKGDVLIGKISGTDLSAIASQYGTTSQSSSDIKFSSNNIAGLGSEPNVLAAAFGQDVGSVSAPIKGNNGVYVVKTTNKNEGVVSSNVPFVRKNMTTSSRSRVGFSLMNALKSIFKAEDNRSKFF